MNQAENQKPDPHDFYQKGIDISYSCLANLAFFRTSRNDDGTKRYAGELRSYLRQNCFYAIVIEWCKIFGSDAEGHHWKKLVSNKKDHGAFREGLYAATGLNASDFYQFWKTMKKLRDQVVAHQFYIERVDVPNFDPLLTSTIYLVNFLYDNEMKDLNVIVRVDLEVKYNEFVEKGDEFWLRNE